MTKAIDRTARDVIGSLNLSLVTMKQAATDMLRSNDPAWSADAKELLWMIKSTENLLISAEHKYQMARAERQP